MLPSATWSLHDLRRHQSSDDSSSGVRSTSTYMASVQSGLYRFCRAGIGLVEIALGLGMLFLWKKKALVGALLALFYVLIFPGNINQYVNHIDAFGLNTDQARLIRLFFQPVLIFLALWSTGGWAYCKKLYNDWKNK